MIYKIIEMPEYFMSLSVKDRRDWSKGDAIRYSNWLTADIENRMAYLSEISESFGLKPEVSTSYFEKFVDEILSSGNFTQLHSDGKPVLSVYGMSLFTDLYLLIVFSLMKEFPDKISISPFLSKKTDILQNMPTVKLCGNMTDFHIFHRANMLALGIIRYDEPNYNFIEEYEKMKAILLNCSDI